MTEYFVYKKHKKDSELPDKEEPLQPPFAYLKATEGSPPTEPEGNPSVTQPETKEGPLTYATHPDGSYDYPEQYDLIINKVEIPAQYLKRQVPPLRILANMAVSRQSCTN